jgi:predicted transglutaminase-like cysteine proteinase
MIGAAAMANEATTTPFMAVTGKTAQPIGHHEFCLAHADECVVRSTGRMRIKLTAERWNQLAEVNNTVNTSIRPTTDQELFGKPEVWVYPTESGDCEDFVLLKRRLLIDEGWPAGALLITVVRQKNGDGHAVLTVTTGRGDLVLDNLDPHISLWSGTEYRYLKRQSEYDTGEWMAIEDGRTQEVGSLSN